MSNSTVNFISSGVSSNATTPQYLELMDIVEIFNMLFCLPTHSYVIFLIVKGSGSGVASEFFTLNLSVCEIAYSLHAVFNVFACNPNIKLLKRFFSGLGITGRPLFQCLICVERYLAVVYPVTFLKYKALRYRVVCCSLAWILIFVSAIGWMFTSGFFYIYASLYSVQFLLFLFIQMFFLVAVLRALKQSGPGEKKREEENHRKRRAFHIILITAVSMIIIYVPFIISGLHYILTRNYIVELFTVGLFCFTLAGFVQLVLFLHRAGKLCCLCCS